jgi:aminoglycoside 3-N-acetyltransferase
MFARHVEDINSAIHPGWQSGWRSRRGQAASAFHRVGPMNPLMHQLPTARLADAARIATEVFCRQVYFRSHKLMEWRSKRLQQKSPDARQTATGKELREFLKTIGVGGNAVVMVHTSVRNVSLISDEEPGRVFSQPIAVASRLLSLLVELLGESGTLVMPTHPLYRDDPGYYENVGKSQLVLTYDPLKTPCNVGLTNELFRVSPGTQRSLHPLQSVSARGPRAAEILAHNLNCRKPLPHGVDSSYYHVCKCGGIVVSIGVPLIECFTLIHTAEDVRDAEWPVKNFFRERRFRVRSGESCDEWIVRERRPLFARSYSEGQLHRDLLREGILHESRVGTIRVDWASAGDVLSFMLLENSNSTYPYYCPRLSLIF